jgi:sodium transport system permease protein
MSHGAQRNTLPARIARLTRKELRETLRDRRTLITLVLMPLLVYPLLSIAFQRFVLATAPAVTEPTYRIGLTNEQDAQLFLEYLSIGESLLAHGHEDRPNEVDADTHRVRLPKIELFTVEQVSDAAANHDVDLGVKLKRKTKFDLPTPEHLAIDVELLYDSDSVRGREALEFVERRIAEVNEGFMQLRLAEQGFKGRARPIEPSRVRVAATGPMVSFPLATLVPFVLILTTITGAVYPAIDLTAGERERGTLEMLVAAPVPRMGLLIAKYVAVVTVAVLTAVVNCGAMTITVYSIGLGKQLFGERGLTAELAIEFCGLLVLFAAFFSAVLLALTSFARSFKEAQAYLVPLMLAATAPGLFTMMNGLRLTPLLAIAPLANIVLLARDMFEYNASPTMALLVLGSTLVYATLALYVAAKLFGSDAVLFGSPGSWSDGLHPGPVRHDTVPLPTALLCLAVVSPVYIIMSNLLGHAAGLSIGVRLGLAAMITLALFAVTPLAVAKWTGVQIVRGLGLGRPPLGAVVGAVVLGVSLWPFAHEIIVFLHERGWAVVGPEKMSRVQAMLNEWQRLSPAWILLCMAFVPALAEEVFFRGFLLGSLRTVQPARSAVLASAAVFGLFHVVVTDSLLIERFLPSTFLGLVLGWIAVRAGSIWPGVALHATHNGLLLLVAYYRDNLLARGWGVTDDAHLPGKSLILATILATAGACIITLSCRKKSDAGSDRELTR